MKRKLLITLIVFVLIALVGAWFSATPKEKLPLYLQQFKLELPKEATLPETDYNPQESTIFYHVPDFSENIFDDEEYLELVGPYAMFYKVGDIETSLMKSQVKDQGIWAEFFYNYFETVKNGDHVTYNKYFFDEYYNSRDKKSEFTMQKIYDIHIEESYAEIKLDEDEYAWVNNKGLEPTYFIVKYKIHENNGSFRIGVSSDTFQSQLYILATDRYNEVKIIDIVALSASGY